MLAWLVVSAAAAVSLLPHRAAAQDRSGASSEYVVRSGDTLYGISRRFGTSVNALIQANGLASENIRVGQRLVIPAPPPPADSVVVPVATDTLGPIVVPVNPPRDTVATDAFESVDSSGVGPVPVDSLAPAPDLGFLLVDPSQSLYDIFLATGLSVDSLLALNPDVGTVFPDSFRLVVPAEFASIVYTVKRGDTLFKIARASGTTVDAIRAANRLTGDVIHIGQRLVVPSTRVVSGTPTEAPLPVVGAGEARIYPDRFVGRLTASGRLYDPEAFMISHRDLPIGSILLLTAAGDRSTFAEVTDRLPASADYVVDVSRAVLRALGSSDGGNIEVEIRVVRYGPKSQ